MSNLREPIATAGLKSLEWDENVEKTIDRVAASGKAPVIGVLLWKAKYGLESAAFRRVIEELTKAYMERYKRESGDLAGKIAEQIASEYIAQFCTRCLGAREIVEGDLKVVCTSCAGSGVRKYSDAERARMMKISYTLTCAIKHKFTWAYNYLADADRAVNDVLIAELERNY